MSKGAKRSLVGHRWGKIRLIFGGFVLAVSIIMGRLFYLQIYQESLFKDLGEKNFIRTRVVLPLRGSFFDCNGVLLAANKPIYDVYWQGSGRYFASQASPEVLQQLSDLLDVDLCDVAKWRSISRADRYGKRFLLKENVSFETLCRMSEACGHISSLAVENRFERVYPFKSLASHLLGYLSRAEKTGKDGLEQLFQEDLSGTPGYVKGVFNATGKKIQQTESQDAQAGKDLTLTLDSRLQAMAENIFSPGESGCILLMDPEDGAIKVFVSYPNVDPNMFLNKITQEQWDEYFVENSPLLNRITRALFPPASLFKLVTFTAGIEEGLITPETVYTCKGFVYFGKRKYLCRRGWGHGELDSYHALAHSCNMHCYTIAQQISIDTLAEYAMRFGLGQKTNFLLPEKSGIVPSSMWKQMYKGERWWPGETLSVTIGHSYLLVTPLQAARMVSAVCTGYLVRPRILEAEQIEPKPLNIAFSTRNFLHEAMYIASQKGSVRQLRFLKNFHVHGKTGTAQTQSRTKKKTDRKHFEHAWVALYFYYKDHKPMTLVAFKEHSGSAREAVAVAKEFLKGYEKIYS